MPPPLSRGMQSAIIIVVYKMPRNFNIIFLTPPLLLLPYICIPYLIKNLQLGLEKEKFTSKLYTPILSDTQKNNKRIKNGLLVTP